MKNLILIFALFIGLFSQAQESVLTISQLAHDGETYTHIKGDENGATNCFVATSTSSLSMSVDGLAVDNIYYNSVQYSWTGPGAEALVFSFNAWDDYDRFYRNRGDARPIRDEAVIALEETLRGCDGWSLDSSGEWHTNPAAEFSGYAYNLVESNGNDGVITHAPQLVANYDGSSPDLRLIAEGGQRIYVGSFNDASDVLPAIMAAIERHRNPATQPESGTSTPSTAVDQWNQGGIQGFAGWTGRYNQQWSNPIYPGYAYSTIDHQYTPDGIFIVRIGVLESGSWNHVDIPGSHNGEAAADVAARAYIASQFTSLDFTTGAGFRHSVFAEGPGLFYSLVVNSDEEVVSWERYATFEEARAAGTNYRPATSVAPADSTIGLCSSIPGSGTPIGFYADNYISSTITENGVSRFDYVSANTAYEYRDVNRTNPWNRFGIYPPTIVVAGNQIKIVSHRSAVEIQPSDVRFTVPMTEDCFVLDAYITTVVVEYRTAFDALVPTVNLPDPTADHSWYNHGSFSSDWTSPRFPGWRYSFQGLTSGVRVTVTNHAGRNFLIETFYRDAANNESHEDFYGRIHAAARTVVVGQDTSFVNEWRYSRWTGYNPTYLGYSYRVSGSNGSYVARIYRDNNQIFSYNSASIDGVRAGAQEHIENLYVN